MDGYPGTAKYLTFPHGHSRSTVGVPLRVYLLCAGRLCAVVSHAVVSSQRATIFTIPWASNEPEISLTIIRRNARGWEASVKFARPPCLPHSRPIIIVRIMDWVNSLAGFDRPQWNCSLLMRVNLNVSRSKDGIIIISIIQPRFFFNCARSLRD